MFANNAIFSKNNVPIKRYFWLIQAPNISKHIPRNGGATIKASRGTAHDKKCFILGQKGHFLPKNGGTMKNVIALNLYIGTHVLVYERRLMVIVYDKVFVFKNIFCKNSYIFFINDPIENIFVLNPSPKYCNANMQKKRSYKEGF